MLRVILVDDEKLSLEQLEYILNQNSQVQIVGSYNSSIEALMQIQLTQPDIVMLDIEMPQKSGIEVARKILDMQKDIFIVFITAYDEYALEAFELEAVDYIVKPFSEKRVNKTVNLIQKRKKDTSTSTNINTNKETSSINQQKKLCKHHKIPVWKNDTIRLLDLSKIYYFTVNGKKAIVCTKDDSFLINETLGQLEERLTTESFLRCYKSFIVNIEHIDRIIPMFNQTYIIKLKNLDIEIPVSRHYSKQLKELLNI